MNTEMCAPGWHVLIRPQNIILKTETKVIFGTLFQTSFK